MEGDAFWMEWKEGYSAISKYPVAWDQMGKTSWQQADLQDIWYCANKAIKKCLGAKEEDWVHVGDKREFLGISRRFPGFLLLFFLF